VRLGRPAAGGAWLNTSKALRVTISVIKKLKWYLFRVYYTMSRGNEHRLWSLYMILNHMNT
ncbi:MAG: hypothetical protein CMB57_06355, partial [Euryarchaeota archaeon]|nr:hypothetical protein [Euryarchaeota archaeon]